MDVFYTPDAEADLDDIWSWIARDSPRAAIRQIDSLIEAVDDLVLFPFEFGEVGIDDVRKRPLGSYLIFYRVRSSVEILRIIHGARDWPSLLDDLG